ncbi:hypothetical protein [Campylobacter troglodytis]|uniref:hypothetical protein n=1 Tax=Campylobacter troglodytis TaxID=654363 RepID=UPI00163BA9AF|nr:hypothetical protein [Campylobacter troglodytis]
MSFILRENFVSKAKLFSLYLSRIGGGVIFSGLVFGNSGSGFIVVETVLKE